MRGGGGARRQEEPHQGVSTEKADRGARMQQPWS